MNGKIAQRPKFGVQPCAIERDQAFGPWLRITDNPSFDSL